MAGLEKITNQIIEEANSSAKEILAKAKEEGEGIVAQAKESAAKEVSSIEKQSQVDVKNFFDRQTSARDLARRTALLSAKQEIIANVIEKAYDSFMSQEPETYFATLLEMIEKSALPKEGIIYLGKKDLDRLPAGYDKKVNDASKKVGGDLTLSKESRKIDGGFILAYGGIEENCSIRALFDAKHDELMDQVYKILFL